MYVRKDPPYRRPELLPNITTRRLVSIAGLCALVPRNKPPQVCQFCSLYEETLMKPLGPILLAASICSMAGISSAYAADSKSSVYLVDRNGNPVTVRSSGCVRSRAWTAERADPRCEGQKVSTSTGRTGK